MSRDEVALFINPDKHNDPQSVEFHMRDLGHKSLNNYLYNALRCVSQKACRQVDSVQSGRIISYKYLKA